MADAKVTDSMVPSNMEFSNDVLPLEDRDHQSIKADDDEDCGREGNSNSLENDAPASSVIPFKQRLPTEIRLQIYREIIATSVSNWKAGLVIKLEWIDEHKDVRIASPLRDATTLALCYESRAATLQQGFFMATSNCMFHPTRDILYVDHFTMKMTEMFQLKALKAFASIETIAVDWRCFQDEEELRETLTFLFAYLRNVQHLILAVPNSRPLPFVASGERDATFVSCPIHLLLDYEALPCYWFYIGQEIHAILKENQFWAEANKLYCLEHIEQVKSMPALPSITISYSGYPADAPPRKPKYPSATPWDYVLSPLVNSFQVWPHEASAIIEELARPTWKPEEDAGDDFNKNIREMI